MSIAIPRPPRCFCIRSSFVQTPQFIHVPQSLTIPIWKYPICHGLKLRLIAVQSGGGFVQTIQEGIYEGIFTQLNGKVMQRRRKVPFCSWSSVKDMNYVVSDIVQGSLNGPARSWSSTARTAKWYLFPAENWVRVHAIGSGRAFTIPIFFHIIGGFVLSAPSWQANNS